MLAHSLHGVGNPTADILFMFIGSFHQKWRLVESFCSQEGEKVSGNISDRMTHIIRAMYNMVSLPIPLYSVYHAVSIGAVRSTL